MERKRFIATILVSILAVPGVTLAQWNRGRNGDDSRDRRGGGYGFVPNVRVDTSGRGMFDGRGVRARITRGWVDTRNNVAVALSGDRNFRVTFYGAIDRGNGDRGFTMRITGSDRGRAQGTAQVQLNRDRNEVEWISVDGRMNGDRFQGNFNRDR